MSQQSRRSRGGPDGRQRLAVVLAGVQAVPPPGVDGNLFAQACLADTYDVVADLAGVDAAIAGPPDVEDLLWPGDQRLEQVHRLDDVLRQVRDHDELVLIPADVPDLPGLILAKVFRGLQRAEVCVAPASDGSGWVALGLRVPFAAWWPLGLDPVGEPYRDPQQRLTAAAPRRGLVAAAPGWHRLWRPEAVQHLDPGLEGWERTRAVLTGRPLA